MINKNYKDKNQLHFFYVTNQINAVIVYEYIKENSINSNDIRISVSFNFLQKTMFV